MNKLHERAVLRVHTKSEPIGILAGAAATRRILAMGGYYTQ